MKNKQISHRDFSSQFKFIRNQCNLHLNRFMLMRNTQTNRRVIVKNHQCQNQQQMKILISDYQKLCQLYQDYNHLCKFIGFNLQQIKSKYTINLIYDYHQRTLEQEIQQMMLKNQKFNQKQLNFFLLSCLKALQSLQKYGLNYLCLTYSNILIQNRNTIDMAYYVLYTPYISSAVVQIKDNNSVVDNYNLSQKQLQLLNMKSQNQANQIDLSFLQKLKIDKQSLGIMLLRMGTTNIVKNRMYTMNQQFQMTLDAVSLKARIEALNKIYSKQFVKKVEYLIFDRTFYSFKDLPNFMFANTTSSNQGSHHKTKSSVQRSLSKSRQRNKSPIQFSSNKKYLNVSSSRLKQTQSYYRPNKLNQPSNISAIAKIRSQTPQNSKFSSSIKQFSPTTFLTESPTKLKGSIYQSLKNDLQQNIFSKIQKDRRQIRKTQDGSDYIGSVKNNRKEGYGICYFKEGDIYAGQWKNDQMEGNGSYLFQNCDLYTGQVQRGLKHGYGKYTYNNGNYYQGQWKNDKKDGFGTFCSKDNSQKYEGYWVNGQKQGQGLYKWKNGDRFQGGFSNGLKSGNGSAFKHDGTKMSGHWYNDNIKGVTSIKFRSGTNYTGQVLLKSNNKLVIQGKGKQVSSDEVIYDGQYKNNMRDGFCKITYPNGDHYEGTIKDNKYQGQGVYFYQHSNCTYKGNWKAGFQSGIGQIIFHNKTKLKCQWQQGKPSEIGKIYYPNGDIYEGELSRQGRNGRGIYIQANGHKFQGSFKNNILVP